MNLQKKLKDLDICDKIVTKEHDMHKTKSWEVAGILGNSKSKTNEKTLQKSTDRAIEEFMEIVTLMELDRDDGAPLYKDGDMRIGAKKKRVDDFIRKTRREACEEMREATKIEKPTEAYLPWLEKEMNIADHIHAEMHVMAARVNCAQDLDEVIQHGNDFRERMKEVVDAVLDQVDKNVEEKQNKFLKEEK